MKMDKEKLKTYGFWTVSALIVLAIVMVVAGGSKGRSEEKESKTDPASQEPLVRYVTKTETVYVDKIVPVEVEKEITTDILKEGLADMGILVTEEYFFKEVTTFESTKTLAWVIKANSKLVMGFEGTLTAGLDFAGIKLYKDDQAKQIRVVLPKSEIFSCSLDLDSFEVYQEDVSKWNPISAEDYTGSLKELETRATERALERGILEKADANAKSLIRSFISGLVDLTVYKLVFLD